MRVSSIIVFLALASKACSQLNNSSDGSISSPVVDANLTLDDAAPFSDTSTSEPTTDDPPDVSTGNNPTPSATQQPTTSNQPTGTPNPPTSSAAPTYSPTTIATTAVPSTPPTPSPSSRCTDMARDFENGSIEQYCHTLNFEYEVEIHPNTSFYTFEQFLIPSIEQGILDSLLPLVVGECANDDNVRRLLSEQNLVQMRNAMNTLRRAEIFGLSTSPTDIRRGVGSNCRAKTSPNHKCSVVSGATMICSTNYIEDKAEVLKVIEDNMEDDFYVDTHEDVVKIYFLGEDEVDEKEEEAEAASDVEEDTGTDESENGTGDDKAGASTSSSSGNNTGSNGSSKEGSAAAAASQTENGLAGAQLWGVILGSAAAIAVLIVVGRKLIADEECDYVYDEDNHDDGGDDDDQDGDKGRDSATSSEDEQV